MALTNHLMTRAIAEATIKSDKIDSIILADLASAGLVARCYVPDNHSREIRALSEVQDRSGLEKDPSSV